VIADVRRSFLELGSFERKRAVYLIWKKPWMVAGADTFINEMMKVAGFDNVVVEDRYPALSADEMRVLNPEVVLLSSEPYPFKDQHVDELRRMLPAARVMLVDGEMFSWYGSRMMKSAGYFKELRATFF
jgi:ABC-type Fe3+-hydroxamate transport system substrate-binding protein